MSEQNIQPLFRLRVEYVKRGRLAYLGHLEVLRTIERIVRRAGLPYAVTQGFSPHMRVGFSSALPVGTSSTSEWFDLFMTELVPVEEALERLRRSSPSDLMPVRCAYIDVRTPALTAQITRAVYKVALRLDPSVGCSVDDVRRGMECVAALGQIPYLRGKKSKVMDLERTLVSYDVDGSAIDGVDCCLVLDTRCDNEGALRPEIVLAALDRFLTESESDEPIVSTGIQDLVAISAYWPQRTVQQVETEDGEFMDPLA